MNQNNHVENPPMHGTTVSYQSVIVEHRKQIEEIKPELMMQEINLNLSPRTNGEENCQNFGGITHSTQVIEI